MTRRKSQKQVLKLALKQLAQARKALDRAKVQQLKGASFDRLEARRLKAQEYRAMMQIEKAMGTYVPIAMRLTPSRMARARRAWVRTEKLISGAAFVKRPSKSKRGHKRRSVRVKRSARKTAKRRQRLPQRVRKRRGSPRRPRLSARRRRISKTKPFKVKRYLRIDSHRFQIALRALREGKSLTVAAREIGVSREHLRSQLDLSPFAVKKGRTWVVRTDWPRHILILTDGRALIITVSDFETASRVGTYLNAVNRFRDTNDPEHLASFVADSVTDIEGKVHVFETNPNTLYRLASTGSGTFEQVYRLVT